MSNVSIPVSGVYSRVKSITQAQRIRNLRLLLASVESGLRHEALNQEKWEDLTALREQLLSRLELLDALAEMSASRTLVSPGIAAY